MEISLFKLNKKELREKLTRIFLLVYFDIIMIFLVALFFKRDFFLKQLLKYFN